MNSKASQSKPLKTRLICTVIWIFAKLPFFISKPLMSFCAKLAIFFQSRSYQTTKTNILLCYPDKTVAKQKALITKSLKHTFRIAPEIAKAWINPCIQDWIGNVYGEEAIKQDLKDDRSVLITGAHIGNWEVALFYLGKTFDFTCMYRKPRYQELDNVICQGRCKNETKMVPGDAQGLRQFLTDLKKCRVAALLSDQEPGGDTGVFAPFFGHSAKTMDLIQKIQKRSKAKLYQIAAIQNAEGLYDIHLGPINIDLELESQHFAAQLNLALEAIIRRYPEQYQWSYKRFKTTEDGSPNPYSK